MLGGCCYDCACGYDCMLFYMCMRDVGCCSVLVVIADVGIDEFYELLDRIEDCDIYYEFRISCKGIAYLDLLL